MLKISRETSEERVTIRLEGRLAGPWVRELERLWRETEPCRSGSLVVELSGVTFIDADGKALLSEMHRLGTVLRARGCMTRAIVEGLVAPRGASEGDSSPRFEQTT